MRINLGFIFDLFRGVRSVKRDVAEIKEGIKNKYQNEYDKKGKIKKEFVPSLLVAPKAYYMNEYLTDGIFRRTFFVGAKPVEIIEFYNPSNKATKNYFV